MAITTLRPNADVAGKSSHWLRSVGGSLFTPLAAASSSGTDYVYADAGMPTTVVWYAAELNGESITLGTKRVGFVQIRGDIQNPTDVGHSVQVRTSIRDLATVKNITPPDYLKSASAGSIVARSGAKQYRNPDGKEWTQANLQRMQIEFYAYRSTGGAFIRLHRIFVDVDLKDKPTVSAVSLANTNTTRPQASGTFTATEGDPLTRAQLKIFTAAQVAASGFSADTTTPVWDSGERATVSLKLDVGQDLAPGVTYHAYLRGAYTLNATAFWSAWASQSFTLVIEPATAPLLTMTPDITLRRAVLAYQGRVNLLSSDDADAEGTVGNWVNGTGMSAVARSTAQAAHGTASVAMTATAVANPEMRNTGNSGAGAATVIAGQQVAGNGRVRTAVTGRAMRMGIRFTDDALTQVGTTTYGATVTDATGAWSTLPTVTAIAPAGATKAFVVVQINATPAAGEVHYYDQGQLVPGSTVPTWSPGGYLPISTARIDAWDRSTGLDNLARLELSATRAGISNRTAADSLTTDPANTFQGADSMAWVPSATTSILDFGYPELGGSFTEDFALPAPAGLLVVASFYARASAAGSYTLTIDSHDGIGGSGAIAGSVTVTIGTTLARYTVTATIPAGGMHGRMTVGNNTGGTGQTVWLSAFQWELRPAGSSTVPDPWVPGQGTAPDWQAVRGMAATVFSGSSQRFALSDFEVPPGIVRVYRALVDTLLSGLETTLASTPSAASMAVIWLPPTGTWVLKDPYFPERNAAVRVIGFGEAINPDMATFQPSGLELPVPFWDAVGGLNVSGGVIQAIGDTEWARLLPLLRNGSTILLDLPEGGHRYYAITGAGWPRAGPLGQIQRAVQVDATQVRRPPDLPSYSGLGFLSTSGGDVLQPAGPPGAWQLTYGEDFSSALDTVNRWHVTEGWTNQNNVTTRAANVSVVGGELRLRLSTTTEGALISADPAFLAGGPGIPVRVGDYAEARVWFPGQDGVDPFWNWPAWWMTAEPNWPAQGEHDIAEVLGSIPNVSELTVNYQSPTGSHNQGAVAGDWNNAYHVYGIHRKASSADVYWDGVLVKSYATDDNGAPNYPRFNIGKDTGRTPVTGATSELRVDWMRIWEPTTGGGGGGGGGGGTPAFTEHVGSAASATGATASGFTTIAGRLLVALVARSGGLATGALTGITDSAGNTWVRAGWGAVSGGSNTRLECWVCPNAAAVSSIAFASGAAQTWAWNILEVTAMASASVVDVASPDGSATTSSTTVTTPAITSLNAADVILAAFHSPTATPTLSAPGFTGLTAFDDGANPARAAYQVVSATGSYQAAWTLSAAQAAGVLTVALKRA